jgi:hypothetical protein
MVAVILTKNWDKASVVLDTTNIASAEELPGQNFGAVVHLFAAVGVNSIGVQYDVKDIPVLETAAEIAAIQNKALREVFGFAASVSAGLAPANDSASKAALRIGDLDDGGTYVGLSAENGKPLHAALADLPDYKTYEEALAAAEQLKSLHPTAHVPTPKELDKNLFDNRNTGHLKGTFNTSGSYPGIVYRSSASYLDNHARVQWFDVGSQNNFDRHHPLPVRLVW